jgi:hypothetical protein
VTVPSFHDLGNATLNCANSSAPVAKSNTFKSGLSAVVSTCAIPAHPFVVLGYIAPAGTHMDSLPEILIPAPAKVVAPIPPLAIGNVPVTSAVKFTPPSLIVTAPLDTAKLSVLKLATPLLLVVASSPAIVKVSSPPSLPSVKSMPSPANSLPLRKPAVVSLLDTFTL